MNQLSAQHVEEGHRIAESIEQMVTRVPNLRHYFQRPPADEDRLYNANYVHTDDMRPDEKSQLVIRQPRTDKYHDPAIHYGLIASADQVMKDAHTRDKLAKEQGILCFEMEAAGLMDRFSCVVIRGICDYSDTHKSGEWQQYAAATAAAYAKELLAVISGDRVYKMVPLSGDMHHEKVLRAVVPAIKSSIDGLVKSVDTLGASADEQKEALAKTSKALVEIHKGLSLLNELQSDYKEKLNTLAENQAGKKSIDQVSDQLKHIQSSQEAFAKSLETLTHHIQVKQEESPSKDWDSLSDKAKEQKVDLDQMISITAVTMKEGSEIAERLGVSTKVTNKIGGVSDIFSSTSRAQKLWKRFLGDKGKQGRQSLTGLLITTKSSKDHHLRQGKVHIQTSQDHQGMGSALMQTSKDRPFRQDSAHMKMCNDHRTLASHLFHTNPSKNHPFRQDRAHQQTAEQRSSIPFTVLHAYLR